MRSFGSACALAAVFMLARAEPVFGQGAEARYTQTLAREEVVRGDLEEQSASLPGPVLDRVRLLVAEYEKIARRYPRSGYSDNALYQAALLSADAFWKFHEERERSAALRLFKAVGDRYPSSSLIKLGASHARRLAGARSAQSVETDSDPPTLRDHPTLRAIRREILPDALRVTLELEQEATFHEERLDGPPRVFVDLRNTRVVGELKDATFGFTDDVVRKIRVGRRQSATRVVLDLEGAARHSVYALYNPYRVVIDFERTIDARITRSTKDPKTTKDTATQDTRDTAAKDTKETNDEPGATWTPEPAASATTGETKPAAMEEPKPAPASPPANRNGSFSLSRQLGLGISRVVIDPGHGGHDPGAHVKGLNEAELTLDVALRLETLLLKIPGVEVVMTRRTNVYIPLEERTAIANRAGADLFLSIHANAAVNTRLRGIETYFLNFAPNPEAEAIAARENAGSAKTMHNLPDIVKAIALNNKIDESRDFASLVQNAMFDRLRKANREARSLGVKQAPFMVLIGATMPSVLAEISFVTNRQEASLLRTTEYRQAIAEALGSGISKYQKSLKAAQTVAEQP